jgi:hypothetical protein
LIVAVSSSCLASSGTVCLLSLTYFRILSQEHGYCWYALNSNKVSLSDINTIFFSFLFKIVGPKKKNYIKKTGKAARNDKIVSETEKAVRNDKITNATYVIVQYISFKVSTSIQANY